MNNLLLHFLAAFITLVGIYPMTTSIAAIRSAISKPGVNRGRLLTSSARTHPTEKASTGESHSSPVKRSKLLIVTTRIRSLTQCYFGSTVSVRTDGMLSV